MKSQQLGLLLGIAVLLAVIFVIDIHIGLGVTPWLLYVVPLGLTYWIRYLYGPLVVASVCIVLIFIGLKMLVEIFHIKVPVYISLLVIVLCLGGSILYSIQANEKDDEEPVIEKEE